MKTLSSIALAAAFAAVIAPPVSAADAAKDEIARFYKDKNIQFIIGTSAGGSYDQWARVIGRHMGKKIPGTPNIVAVNMPGAGGITATNHLFNRAPRDGTTIAIFSRNIPTQALLNHPAVKFNTRDMNWIGSPELTNRVCVARKGAKVQKAEDLFERELIVGGSGIGTTVSNTPVVLRGVLGMKFRVIEGYQGAQNVVFAIEKGEVEGICQTIAGLESTNPGWQKKGDLIPLFNLEQKRVPGLGAPSVFDYVKTKDQRQTLAFFFSSTELGRPIAAPPGVPAARVNALRRAFDATMADPAFIAESRKMGLVITALTGEELTKVVADLAETPDDIVQKISAITQKKKKKKKKKKEE